MAPIVAPTICRFTVNGTYAGEDIANIVDMHIDTTGSIQSRESACEEVANDILVNWHQHIREFLCTPYTCRSVSWVDINSLDGSTGETSSSAGITWPANGADNGQSAPGNVAIRIDKAQDGGRRARNGRMYLVGVPESWQANGSNNTFNGENITSVNESLNDFLDGLNDTEVFEDTSRKMVVVHTVGGVFQNYSDVTALTMNPNVASQRRRLSW